MTIKLSTINDNKKWKLSNGRVLTKDEWITFGEQAIKEISFTIINPHIVRTERKDNSYMVDAPKDGFATYSGSGISGKVDLRATMLKFGVDLPVCARNECEFDQYISALRFLASPEGQNLPAEKPKIIMLCKSCIVKNEKGMCDKKLPMGKEICVGYKAK